MLIHAASTWLSKLVVDSVGVAVHGGGRLLEQVINQGWFLEDRLFVVDDVDLAFLGVPLSPFVFRIIMFLFIFVSLLLFVLGV